DKGAEVVGRKLRRKALQIEVPHPAYVDTTLERMFTKSIGEVIAELSCLRLGNTGLIPTDRFEACPGAEVEGWEGVSCGMLASVHARQVQIAQSGRSLNRKVDAGDDVGETVAKLIEDLRRDGIGV